MQIETRKYTVHFDVADAIARAQSSYEGTMYQPYRLVTPVVSSLMGAFVSDLEGNMIDYVLSKENLEVVFLDTNVVSDTLTLLVTSELTQEESYRAAEGMLGYLIAQLDELGGLVDKGVFYDRQNKEVAYSSRYQIDFNYDLREKAE